MNELYFFAFYDEYFLYKFLIYLLLKLILFITNTRILNY